MKQKIFILATTVLCLFSFVNEAIALDAVFNVGNSYADHRCWSNITSQVAKTGYIELNPYVYNGTFHHYNVYLRNVNDMNTNIASWTDITSTSQSSTRCGVTINTAGTYRVCIVVYNSSGTELLNTKNDSWYNFTVVSSNSSFVSTGSADNITCNSARLSGGCNVSGYGCRGVRYRVGSSGSWTYVSGSSDFITVSGLSQGTNYQFTYWGDYSWGIESGTVSSFTTLSTPSIPSSISGNTSVCAVGGAQTYSISSVSGATSYTWTLPSGWTGSSTGTSISATPGTSAASGNISVTANSSCGSSSARTLYVTVSTSPTAPTSISGTTTICSGSSTTLTASGGSTGSGCTYQWYSGGCGSGSVLGTGQSITVSPTSNTTYYVRRVSTSPCSTTTNCTSVTVTINAVPSQPSTITGTTPVCANSGAKTYSISAVSGATGYTWSVPSGWTINSGQNSTSISVTPGANAQSGNISVTASNSCGSSTVRTYSVTVNAVPSQPGTITGTTSVCAGSGAQTYSISAVSGATSYTWTLPSGWSGSSTGTSISAMPTSSAQSGNISVTANNSCGSSTTRTLSVTVSTVPAQPGTISGSTSVDAGSGAKTYSISAVSGATSYTWTLPSGWSGSSTSTSISATPTSSAQSGNIKVTANNNCGSSSERTLYITVNTPTPPPSQPGTISGTTSVCAGSGAQTYSISGVSGATSYTWTLPSGWSGSSTGTSISATPTSSAQSGNISVTANNSSGSSPARTLSVSVSIQPTAPTSINGTTTISLGQSTTLTATGGSTGSSCTYQWYSGSCGSGSVLGTGQSITVSPTSNTTYYVRRVGTSPCNITTNCAMQSVTVSSPCKDVTPLLYTHWNQCLPYNAKCPTVAGALNGYAPYAPAGCVAITMAQIMKHYNHPTQRTQPIIPSRPELSPIYGTTTYQWNSMQNTYGVSYSGTTQENAVATLIKEIGVAVNMGYSAEAGTATSTSSVSAFQTNFGYYTDAKSKYYFTDNEWEQLIRSELLAGHPVFYGGTNTTASRGGHAFVCDGYECSTNRFNINWGWGNSEYDGYFVLSALNLDWNHDGEINEKYVVNAKGDKIYDKKYNDGQMIIFAIPNYNFNDFYTSTSDGVNTFSIIANAGGSEGYIIPQGTVNIYSGTNQAYAFEAKEGYEIDQVFIDGIPNTDAVTNGYYIFANVTANHSIIVTFKKSVTGIEDIHSQEIFIYPNPTTNDLFIKSESPIDKIEIYSLTGTLLMQENNFNEKISVSALQRGVYLLKVYTGKGLIIKKVVRK